MSKIRLKFSKHGPVRFVGHLDVMRYFQKVMRRAGVDIAWSEGYSPHPLMSFAQPLSVGATSDGEYMDMTLRSFADLRKPGAVSGEMSGEDAARLVMERINAVCHEGITVTDACLLPEKAEKAMTAVAACAWRVSFRRGMLPEALSPEWLLTGFGDFTGKERILALKKTKKGTRETDLKPLVYAASVLRDTASYGLLLQSGSEDNVKPALLMGAYLRHVCSGEESLCRIFASEADSLFLAGDELNPAVLRLHRIETYRKSEDAQGSFFEPLIPGDISARIRI